LQHLLDLATHHPAVHSKPTPTNVRNVTRRLGLGTINQLVAEYVGGIETTDLTVKYGLSKTSVLKLLDSNGVSMRRQPLTEEQVTDASVLYESGKSLTAIVEQLDLPRESIRRALIDAGITMRRRGGAQARSKA